MAALGVEFGSLVQGSSKVCREDGKFLCRAKVARSCPGLAWYNSRHNALFSTGIFSYVFHLSDSFR